MRKNYLFVVVLLMVGMFFSCSNKKENIDPNGDTGKKKGRYMPLAVGNSWTYESNAEGEYIGTVTGKIELQGKEYYTITNTIAEKTSYMNYEGNKLYGAVTGVRMLMLDEDARAGQQWQAGKIENNTEYYNSLVLYVGKYIAHHDNYTVEGTTYNDVVEVEMTTTSSFKFTQTAMNLLDKETRDFMEAIALSASVQINQRTFYAKNVGFIFQYSDDMPALGSKLLEYTLK